MKSEFLNGKMNCLCIQQELETLENKHNFEGYAGENTETKITYTQKQTPYRNLTRINLTASVSFNKLIGLKSDEGQFYQKTIDRQEDVTYNIELKYCPICGTETK